MRARRLSVLALQIAVLAILIAVVLSGCAAPPVRPVQTRYVVNTVKLPLGLLSCAPEPAVGTIKSQRDVADYLVRLEEAGADCRDDVVSIAQIENAAPK